MHFQVVVAKTHCAGANISGLISSRWLHISRTTPVPLLQQKDVLSVACVAVLHGATLLEAGSCCSAALLQDHTFSNTSEAMPLQESDHLCICCVSPTLPEPRAFCCRAMPCRTQTSWTLAAGQAALGLPPCTALRMNSALGAGRPPSGIAQFSKMWVCCLLALTTCMQGPRGNISLLCNASFWRHVSDLLAIMMQSSGQGADLTSSNRQRPCPLINMCLCLFVTQLYCCR